jgi:hypothetical protein
MYVTHDERNSDPAYGLLIAEAQTDLKALDYALVRQKDGRTWLVQVIAPNLYLPKMGGDPFNPTILHGLQLSQEHKGVRSATSRFVFRMLYLGEIVSGIIRDTGSRPAPGAEGIKPDINDLCGYLSIPVFNNNQDQSNAIGILTNLDGYPLCFEADLFRRHLGIYGTNGAGKTNGGANVILQAVNADMCVLVHDVKPDYCFLHQANTDPRVKHVWPDLAKFHLGPRGLTDVHVIGFKGKCNHQSVDTIIGLNASDFTADELAALQQCPATPFPSLIDENGISPPSQRRIDEIARIRPELLKKIATGKISIRAAYRICVPTKDSWQLSDLRSGWRRATDADRQTFLAEMGLTILPKPGN